MGGVRNGAGRDVLKVWLYAVAVVLLAAWTSPLLYNAGKAMGEVTEGKQTNGVLKWLGARCREADFPVFFVAALVGFALLLFLPFSGWLALKRKRGGDTGQALAKNPRGLLDLLTGLFLAAGIFLLMGYGLVATGSFVWLGAPVTGWEWLLRALPWILLGVVVQEWLLRGVALGIFLRGMRPPWAILLAAGLAVAVHLLKPPAGLNVPDPDGDGVGFTLLKMLGARLADPRVVVAELPGVAALALALGYARWRTASLWLPVGLHAGWKLADVLFVAVARPVPQADPLAALLAGRNLTEGLLPLAGFLVLCGVVYFFTNGREGSDEAA